MSTSLERRACLAGGSTAGGGEGDGERVKLELGERVDVEELGCSGSLTATSEFLHCHVHGN